MPKRGSDDVDVSKTKRRKAEAASSPEADLSMSDPIASGNEVFVGDVKELGLKLWETMTAATDKDKRLISTPFLAKPAKRDYPDYYQIIKEPIAFDDIKKRLLLREYRTLDDVKRAFELCFNNAMEYNQPGSPIYLDAEALLRLTKKTYRKLTSPGNEDHSEDKKDKNKPASLSRTIKGKLQRLVELTDDYGNILAQDFMELPPKKLWPIYYEVIKKPQCIENVFKHIKRKEYTSSSDFAADVELIFSNAMDFNEESSDIYKNAIILRDAFRQSMTDLPPQFALPQYSKPANPKIKLKMPALKTSKEKDSGSQSISVTLKVPANPSNAKASSSKSNQTTKTEPAMSAIRIVKPAPAAPVATKEAVTPAKPAAQTPKANVVTRQAAVVSAPPAKPPQATTRIVSSPVQAQSTVQPLAQPAAYVGTFSHYPNATYTTPLPATKNTSPPLVAPTPVPAAATFNHMRPYSASQSPAPLSPAHMLRCVSLKFEPRGRVLQLDHSLGVKNWSVRLGGDETSVDISDVTFMGGDDAESSASEEEEEIDGEGDIDMDGPTKNGKKRGKKGRGRPPPKAKTKAKVVTRSAKVTEKKSALEEIQVKLDGVVMKEKEENAGKWTVALPIGTHTVEVGEKGGLNWKVYFDRREY